MSTITIKDIQGVLEEIIGGQVEMENEEDNDGNIFIHFKGIEQLDDGLRLTVMNGDTLHYHNFKITIERD